MYEVWAIKKDEPTALANKPDLRGYLVEYYKAFRILSTRRPRSFDGGLCPIPISEIAAYLNLFGCDDEEEFVSVICAVDSALLKRIRDKSESSKPTK